MSRTTATDPARDIGVVAEGSSNEAHVAAGDEKDALDSPTASDDEPEKEFREGGYGW